MTLYRRTLLTTIATILVLVIVVTALTHLIFLQNFARLEQQQVEREVKAANVLIEAELEQLSRAVTDWGPWDDTYRFAVDLNSDYKMNMLTVDALTNLKVEFVIFIDPSGKVIYSQGTDLDEGTSVPVPPGLLSAFTPGNRLFRFDDPPQATSGIVILPAAPVMAAAHPILTSLNEGPSHGILVFCRRLDANQVDLISQKAGISLQVFSVQVDGVPDRFLKGNTRLENLRTTPLVLPLNNRQVSGFLSFYDIYGKPALLVEVQEERAIWQQGLLITRYFIALLLVMALVVGIFLVRYLSRHVLNRVAVLASDVEQIGRGHDLSRRVGVQGKDELGRLEQEINRMLAQIEDAERERRENEQRLEMVVKGSEHIIVMQDLEGRYLYFNGSTHSRHLASEMIGRLPGEVYPPERALEIRHALERVLANGESFTYEHQVQWEDESRWFMDHVYPVKDSADKMVAIGTISRNISAYKAIEEKLRYAALHDSLTNLPNRLYFIQQLRKLLLEIRSHPDQTAAILFMDLDRFKVINDSLGHAVGDQVLVVVGQRMKSVIRPDDIVSRFGGDEFAVLLQRVNGIQGASQVASRLQMELAKPIHLQGQDLFTSASIGIILVQDDGVGEDELMRKVDVAMYRAKSTGGARHEVFIDEMGEFSRSRLELESQLRRAVQNLEEIVVYYQPIVSCLNRRVVAYEALARWNHPQRGLILPAGFIPLAEEIGLISELGEWVLRQACLQLKKWHELGFSDLRMAVNISALQFHDLDFVDLVRSILQDTGIEGRMLKLEITESMAILDASLVADTILRLKELGVGVSIDDFGTSYSSLSYLKRFEVESIKIDRGFIQDISESMESGAITASLLAIGRMLEIMVIGEGVESEAQFRFLKNQGCDEVQGFLFSCPEPPEVVTRHLTEEGLRYAGQEPGEPPAAD